MKPKHAPNPQELTLFSQVDPWLLGCLAISFRLSRGPRGCIRMIQSRTWDDGLRLKRTTHFQTENPVLLEHLNAWDKRDVDRAVLNFQVSSFLGSALCLVALFRAMNLCRRSRPDAIIVGILVALFIFAIWGTWSWN